MVEFQLSALERAVMIVLIAEARDLSSMELEQDFGITLRGDSRRKLNELGLVATRTFARSYIHVLTDYGWQYCRSEFMGKNRPFPGPTGGAMTALLRGVGRFMDKTGYTLAEVFDHPKSLVDTQVGRDGPHDIEDRIRQAYSELAGKAGDWVSLRKLRLLLAAVPSDAAEVALVALAREGHALLAPEPNQKVLTDADRRAAIHIGGEAKHLIAFSAA